jgi:hypothetical protein
MADQSEPQSERFKAASAKLAIQAVKEVNMLHAARKALRWRYLTSEELRQLARAAAETQMAVSMTEASCSCEADRRALEEAHRVFTALLAHRTATFRMYDDISRRVTQRALIAAVVALALIGAAVLVYYQV